MRLEQHRTLWGTIDIADGGLARAPHKTFDELIPTLAALGYDGIEIPFKMCLHIGVEKIISMLKAHNMRMSVMTFTDNVVVPGDPAGGFLWGGPYATRVTPPRRRERSRRRARGGVAQHQNNSKICDGFDNTTYRTTKSTQHLAHSPARDFPPIRDRFPSLPILIPVPQFCISLVSLLERVNRFGDDHWR